MTGRVRFGGRDSPAGWLFELSGGHVALDLVNSVDERPLPTRRELLPDYATLLRFATQTGLTTAAEARRLSALAARRPAAAEACVRRVRGLREALFALFTAASSGATLPERHLAALNAALPSALARLRLRGDGTWVFVSPPEALDAMCAPLVKAAADLLASPALSRVRRCDGDGCHWLFLDDTRNRSRRWCDMTVCGNRAKARRHRQRRPAHGTDDA